MFEHRLGFKSSWANTASTAQSAETLEVLEIPRNRRSSTSSIKERGCVGVSADQDASTMAGRATPHQLVCPNEALDAHGVRMLSVVKSISLIPSRTALDASKSILHNRGALTRYQRQRRLYFGVVIILNPHRRAEPTLHDARPEIRGRTEVTYRASPSQGAMHPNGRTRVPRGWRVRGMETESFLAENMKKN